MDEQRWEMLATAWAVYVVFALVAVGAIGAVIYWLMKKNRD